MEKQERGGAQRGKNERLLGNQRHHGDQGDTQSPVDQIESGKHQARIETLAHHFEVELAKHATDQTLANLIAVFAHGAPIVGGSGAAHGKAFGLSDQFRCAQPVLNVKKITAPEWVFVVTDPVASVFTEKENPVDGFFAQALVLLGATLILLPLFQRLGLGSILGYLAAGIAVGPLGLALISDGTHVLHFAELGVVLMLFLVGLELAPQHLWAQRRSLVGLGATQMVASA